MKKTGMGKLNKASKIFVIICALVLSLASLTSCEFFEGILNSDIFSDSSTAEVKDFTVKFLDVGQGDSILIMTKNETMLIDAGDNDCGTGCVNKYLNKYGIKKLDYIVVTHAHADHIGGMDEVISYVGDIGTVFMTQLPESMVPSTSSYNKLLRALINSNADVIYPAVGYSFDMDGARVTFLGPADEYNDINDSSLVVRIDYGENSFLFTGDLSKKSFKLLADAGADFDVDVLKVSHHGSNDGTNQYVLDETAPEYAVISCGKDNSYNHPHVEVIESLENSGIDYYETDINGTVTMVSDGKTITVETEKGDKNGK